MLNLGISFPVSSVTRLCWPAKQGENVNCGTTYWIIIVDVSVRECVSRTAEESDVLFIKEIRVCEFLAQFSVKTDCGDTLIVHDLKSSHGFLKANQLHCHSNEQQIFFF